MNTGHYVTPESLIFNASAFAGDIKHEYIPKGVFMSWIRDAFVELNMQTSFQEQRVSVPFDTKTLTIPLPEDCFDIRNIYMFNGTECTFDVTKKVYWKKNYYTQGVGYVANDKWNNGRDPIFTSHDSLNPSNPNDRDFGSNSLLFYNVQLGNLMFSSNCASAGSMVHIHYSGTGSSVMDAPIIPIYFKNAIEDYITEAGLRMRMAMEPASAKMYAFLQQTYEKRLDKEGMRGSWHNAKSLAKSMNTEQRNDLNNYLSRGGWGSGR